MPKKVEGRTNVRLEFAGEDLDRFEALKKHYGIDANSALITMLLKREYDQVFVKKPRFEHVNVYNDHVKILDRELEKSGRIVSVYFKRDRAPYCDYDQAKQCVHIDYAWEIPEAAMKLREAGFRDPAEKK